MNVLKSLVKYYNINNKYINKTNMKNSCCFV